jgi:hypothetical protein
VEPKEINDMNINLSDGTKIELHKFTPWFIVFVLVIWIVYIFRENLDIKTWDFIAVAIALGALYVAIRSLNIAKDSLDIATQTLGISKETLSSQKITQENTNPIYTYQTQSLVLSNMAVGLVENFCKSCALHKFLKQNQYEGFPIPRLLEDLNIDYSNIQLERAAYTNANYFLDLSLLQQDLIHYNKLLDSTQRVMESSEDSAILINNELSCIMGQIASIFNSVCDIFKRYQETDIKAEEGLRIDDVKRPFERLFIDYGLPIDRLLKILDDKKREDEDILITSPKLYTEMCNNVSMFFPNKMRENFRELFSTILFQGTISQTNWIERVLGYLAYQYYKRELKDFVIVHREK